MGPIWYVINTLKHSLQEGVFSFAKVGDSMATIATGLAIYDQMSNVLNNITNAMNLTVAAMTNMENTMDRSFDNKAIEAARNSVYSASSAYAEMANEIEKVVMGQEKLKPPEMPQWNTFESVDVFQTSGMERYVQEIESANQMLNDLQRAQQQISNADMQFLPAQAITDINNLEQRVMGLRGLLQQVEMDKQKLGKNAPAEAFNDVNSAIENIRNQLHEAIQAQNTMNTAMKAGDLSKVNAAYNQLFKHVEKTEHGIRDSINAQEKFNKEIQKGEDLAGGLMRKIVGIASAYLGIQAMKGFLTSSFGAATEQIRAEQRLQTIMSQINGMTQDGIDLVKQQARELEKVTAIASGVGIYGQSQLAQYVYDPSNIKAMTQAMYDLATETYGVGVTQDQIAQTANLMGKVMMGDINALSRNGFKIDAIFDEAEQKMLKFGTEAERAALVVQMIEENLNGLSQAMANTPEGAVQRMANSWGAVQEVIGYGLIPIFNQFSDLIQANMPTIQDVFVNVFATIFSILENFMSLTSSVVSFFVENWSWIGPILWGVATALGIVAAALVAVAVKQAIVNAVMKLNPYVFIISTIIALAMWIYKLIKTNDNFVAAFMRGWNWVLNMADLLKVGFTVMANGIDNAFYSAKVGVLQSIESMINKVIDGLNWLRKKSNDILGTSFDLIDHVELTATAEMEAEMVRRAGEERLDLANEEYAQKVAEREQRVQDFLENRAAERAAQQAEREEMFKAPPMDGIGSLPTGMWDIPDEISRVDEVGKIKDKVDISSEDLKMMRELAEMKNIQNFVTLTPTVSVQTGDINTGDDIDTIIAQITDRLETQIASSAQGVYA